MSLATSAAPVEVRFPASAQLLLPTRGLATATCAAGGDGLALRTSIMSDVGIAATAASPSVPTAGASHSVRDG